MIKLYSTSGSAKILDLPEALLPMTNRHAMLLTGLLELLTSLGLIFGKQNIPKLISIAWLGSNFVLYRAASLLLVVGKPCPCLGSMTEKIPVSPLLMELVLRSVVIYLILGSFLFLIGLRRAHRQAIPQGTRVSQNAERAAT
jgi:hypothetical protein